MIVVARSFTVALVLCTIRMRSQRPGEVSGVAFIINKSKKITSVPGYLDFLLETTLERRRPLKLCSKTFQDERNRIDCNSNL